MYWDTQHRRLGVSQQLAQYLCFTDKKYQRKSVLYVVFECPDGKRIWGTLAVFYPFPHHFLQVKDGAVQQVRCLYTLTFPLTLPRSLYMLIIVFKDNYMYTVLRKNGFNTLCLHQCTYESQMQVCKEGYVLNFHLYFGGLDTFISCKQVHKNLRNCMVVCSK